MSSTSSSEQPPDDPALDQIGPALSRLRRRVPASSKDLSRTPVLNVIADAPGETTVGGLAAEMGVAQPVASRTVAACIADGLLRRAGSQSDRPPPAPELHQPGGAR